MNNWLPFYQEYNPASHKLIPRYVVYIMQVF